MADPIINKDSFWADLVNSLLMRSLYRTPKGECPKVIRQLEMKLSLALGELESKERAFDIHREIDLFPIRAYISELRYALRILREHG